jgi:replicative DNA helicase
VYLTANKAARIALLQGLLDADGWVERWGSMRFCSSSKRLAHDVVELVRSLGGWCSVSPKRATYTYLGTKRDGLTAYVCNLHYRNPQSLFLLTAKRTRLADAPRRAWRPVVVSVEPTRVTETQCISVTHSSGLYVTDDDVVTHNTSLAMNMAEHAALESGLPVGIFSMEMASTQLVMRMLGSVGKLDQHKLRTGRLQDADWARLTHAVGKLNDAPIHVDETAALNPLELRARARRLHRQYRKLGLVVVDYLQLMSASSDGENRATELSEISRSMKALAKELGCPVVALSQLNRSLEQRPNKRPVMSDLRECVTGDTLVWLSSGRRVPIHTLVGAEPEVWGMSQDRKIVSARSDKVWSVGVKPVLRAALASGRVLRATEKHRVFGARGWARIGDLVPGDRLAARWTADDLFWDTVVDVRPDGEEEVFDLTVPGPASWLADGIVSHNSGAIEQDADLILFIYRDEVYNPETADKGIAEIIIGKQRNGPIGTVRLAFLGEYTRFENLADPTRY